MTAVRTDISPKCNPQTEFTALLHISHTATEKCLKYTVIFKVMCMY